MGGAEDIKGSVGILKHDLAVIDILRVNSGYGGGIDVHCEGNALVATRLEDRAGPLTQAGVCVAEVRS